MVRASVGTEYWKIYQSQHAKVVFNGDGADELMGIIYIFIKHQQQRLP